MATNEFWRLTSVSDAQLLQGLSGLLPGGARVEARIVAHLAEVEERRLHLKAATSSLFEYCLRRLGLSESEAFHRITAARLARRFPLIFRLLEARAIHLSALRVLRDHLTNENHRELLATASGKSKKEVEALVAAIAPRPDVASLIRKLPAPKRSAPASSRVAPEVSGTPTAMSHAAMTATATQTSGAAITATQTSGAAMTATETETSGAAIAAAQTSGAAMSATVAETSGAARSRGTAEGTVQRPTEAPALEPLSSTRYLLRVSIGAELKDKLDRALDLMSHANPNRELALVLERALDLLLDKLGKQRFGQTQRPRAARKVPHEHVSRRAENSNQESRRECREPRKPRREHISNETRRAVARRDEHQCTYVDGEGRRCGSRAFLELHHEQAHALGGPPTIENLRLLCSAHNRLLAEQDFGRVHQERFTRPEWASNLQATEDEKPTQERASP